MHILELQQDYKPSFVILFVVRQLVQYTAKGETLCRVSIHSTLRVLHVILVNLRRLLCHQRLAMAFRRTSETKWRR